MAKKEKTNLVWLGPGTLGTGKDRLNPGDPLPADFSEKDMKRFARKIGEPREKTSIAEKQNLQALVKKLEAQVRVLEGKLEDQKTENDLLIEQIEKLKTGGAE
ncbi:hypothetical protein AMJ80_02405 [bacterium SM23_31]|nr:MAG: hypothetical protein AMJ80_02405 [bacterium SM23_31]